jgi:hypothetical protein
MERGKRRTVVGDTTLVVKMMDCPAICTKVRAGFSKSVNRIVPIMVLLTEPGIRAKLDPIISAQLLGYQHLDSHWGFVVFENLDGVTCAL